MADLSTTVAVLFGGEDQYRAVADKLVDALRSLPMLDDATNARFARIGGAAKFDAVVSPPTGDRAHVAFEGSAPPWPDCSAYLPARAIGTD